MDHCLAVGVVHSPVDESKGDGRWKFSVHMLIIRCSAGIFQSRIGSGNLSAFTSAGTIAAKLITEERLMKVCITARGEGLTAEVDPTFGRAAYFVFIDTETRAVETVANVPGAHGAGVQAAQTVAEKGASAVITGSVGPNAYQGLAAAGIEMYTGATGTVKEALDAFNTGKLTRSGEATGVRHGGGGGRGIQ